jgi:hypothetical protein
MDRIRVLEVRGQAVVLDSDLAAVYGVTTGNFNKAVGRNLARFPEDFSFILSPVEFEAFARSYASATNFLPTRPSKSVWRTSK